MALFRQLFQFKGKHADMVRTLVDKLGGSGNCRNIDIFYISIVMGIWQNKIATIDDDKKIEPAKIDSEQMIRYEDDIIFFYRLVMLSDKKYCLSEKERVDKAFRIIMKPEATDDEKHFVEVMLGGLEFLNEQICLNTITENDRLNKIKNLVELYQEQYGTITAESLRVVE